MNQSNVGLLDLPNEILFIILKKLDNVDVLYSLLDVDSQRLDIIAQENSFTNTLDFVLTTSTDDIFSLTDTMIDRFSRNILPRIHHNIKSLILDSVCMERILLAADYPNLTELKLFNFNGTFALRYFTDKSPFQHTFQSQIIDLILVFEKKFNKISEEHYSRDVYGCILKFFENLKHLSIIESYPYFIPPLIVHDLPLTTFFYSAVNKLCIRVMNFEDCLALLDGRLKQLTTLIVVVCGMNCHSSKVYKIDDLPNLKCLSLTTFYCLSESYDIDILPLFPRMSNLEELSLSINIHNRTAFIDGTHIYNEILVYVSRLHIFNFYIATNTEMDHLVLHVSTDDIRRTLGNIKYGQVDCIVNYKYGYAQCHVFSLPFMFEDLSYIGNIFPSIIFRHVTRLVVSDEVPFKHEFFNRIAWSFPLLKRLSVRNINPQSSISDKGSSNDNELYSIVKYPYLTSLGVTHVHMDYVEQFLNERKTHLPRLTELTVNYVHLKIVTENFTRDGTRLNCIKVKELNMRQPKAEHSKDFHVYFPLLKPCFCSN